jgi:hypothetical protein
MNAFHRPSNASFFLVPLLMALGAALPLAAQDEAAPERAAEAAEAYAPRDVSEAIALRMESLGDRAPGPLALRLSLREAGPTFQDSNQRRSPHRLPDAYEAELASASGPQPRARSPSPKASPRWGVGVRRRLLASSSEPRAHPRLCLRSSIYRVMDGPRDAPGPAPAGASR